MSTDTRKMPYIYTLCIIVSLALTSLGLQSCQSSPSTDTRPLLTVSIEPLRYFTEQIAGDRYRVVSLVPVGSSPETYEPKPDQLMTLSDSKAYLRIGMLPFEKTWLERLLSITPQMPVIDVAQRIPLLRHHEETDLHVWTSPQNVRIMAQNIADFLSQQDSVNAPYYADRLQAFEQRIDSLDLALKATLDNLSHRTFIMYHPALAYFAKAYGLVQLSMETHGKEPSATYLGKLIQRARKEHVHVIFMQKEFPASTVNTLAQELQARIVTINPLSYNWEQELLHTAQALRHE